MTFVVPLEARGQRVDQIVAGQVEGLSRARVQALLEQGAISVDGKALAKDARLRGGEQVSVVIPAAVEAVPIAQDLPIKVLHEDKDILVLDKAAGMVVHPGAGHHDGTLVNALLHHVKDLSGVGGVLRPGLVHRLDKETSGLLVICKHEKALKTLQEAFAAREVEKIYLALVKGQPDDSGTFSTLYGRHPTQRQKFSSKVTRGKPAVTHYTVKERFTHGALVEVGLETGRTHQIRVHFSDAGFPLFGDEVYGRSRKGPTPIARQALHAHRLSFEHPRTGKRVEFTAKPPADFNAAVKALRSDSAD